MYSDPPTQKLELEFTQDLIFYTREWTRKLITINPIRPVAKPKYFPNILMIRTLR